jgi:Ca2+-binding RTX toxin-like protein
MSTYYPPSSALSLDLGFDLDRSSEFLINRLLDRDGLPDAQGLYNLENLATFAPYQGETVVTTISVTNEGSCRARNVVVDLTLDLPLLTLTDVHGGTLTDAGDTDPTTFQLRIGQIHPGDTRQVSLTYTVADDAPLEQVNLAFALGDDPSRSDDWGSAVGSLDLFLADAEFLKPEEGTLFGWGGIADGSITATLPGGVSASEELLLLNGLGSLVSETQGVHSLAVNDDITFDLDALSFFRSLFSSDPGVADIQLVWSLEPYLAFDQAAIAQFAAATGAAALPAAKDFVLNANGANLYSRAFAVEELVKLDGTVAPGISDWQVLDPATGAVANRYQQRAIAGEINPAGPSNVILGTEGDDLLIGTPETELILALGGNDTVYGNGGADDIRGGSGGDALFGSTSAERIDGGAGDDTLYGNGGRDVLLGGDGDDVIYGSADSEIIFGGAGDDTLYSNGGSDTLNAGPGFDTVFLASGQTTVVLETGVGFATIHNFQLGQTRFQAGAIAQLSFADASQGAVQGVEIRQGNDLLAFVNWQSASTFSANQGLIFTA